MIAYIWEREEFEAALKEAVLEDDRDAVTTLVALVAAHYRDMPDELKRYLSVGSSLSRGAASAAWAMITGDFGPAATLEYGGLGMSLAGDEGSEEMAVIKNQFWYVHGYGHSLGRIAGCDNSLRCVTGEGDAFEGIVVTDSSLYNPRGKGRAFKSINVHGKDSCLKPERRGGDTFIDATRMVLMFPRARSPKGILGALRAEIGYME